MFVLALAPPAAVAVVVRYNIEGSSAFPEITINHGRGNETYALP